MPSKKKTTKSKVEGKGEAKGQDTPEAGSTATAVMEPPGATPAGGEEGRQLVGPPPLNTETPLGPTGNLSAPPGGRALHDDEFDGPSLASVRHAKDAAAMLRQSVSELLSDKKKTQSEADARLTAIRDSLRELGFDEEGRPLGMNGHADVMPSRPQKKMGRPKGSKTAAKPAPKATTKAKAVNKHSGDNKGNATMDLYNVLKRWGVGKKAKGVEAGPVAQLAAKELRHSPKVIASSLQALRRASPPKAVKDPEKGRGGKYYALPLKENSDFTPDNLPDALSAAVKKKLGGVIVKAQSLMAAGK